MSRRMLFAGLTVFLMSGCAPALVARGGPDGTQLTAADIERFQPDQLLNQVQQLRLTESQYGALQMVLRDRTSGVRNPTEAAQAAVNILAPEQRNLVRSVAPRHGHH